MQFVALLNGKKTLTVWKNNITVNTSNRISIKSRTTLSMDIVIIVIQTNHFNYEIITWGHDLCATVFMNSCIGHLILIKWQFDGGNKQSKLPLVSQQSIELFYLWRRHLIIISYHCNLMSNFVVIVKLESYNMKTCMD